jgi:hypothetical protein
MKSSWEKNSKIMLLWLSLAATLTVLCGLVYVAVQQDLRQGANDPQIQMAEDAARALANGTPPNVVAASNADVDIASSLAPYLVVFNDPGQPIAGSGKLNGNLPSLPTGVFAYTKAYGEDRITWEPQPYVREATVIIRYSGAQSGFVLAGRSLREVEIRVDQLNFEVIAVWLFGLFITLVTTAIFVYRKELIERMG